MNSGRAVLIRFLAFVIVMIFFMVAIIVVFGQLRFDKQDGYHAEFTSASGLKSGEFVRIAGVEVGRVTGVSVAGNVRANVDFTLDRDVKLTQSTRAVIRYKNLTGDRYLELTEGVGSSAPLRKGSVIPVQRTDPALDLDALMGGFRPLFKALDPDSVNRLSGELIAVFQGQGGTVANVLSQIGELTNSLADRDQLIGAVLTNLNTTLTTVNRNHGQFDSMIDNLQQLVSGIAERADPVAAALEHVSGASKTVADLLGATRPAIADDVNQLNRLSTNINNDGEWFEGLLGRLPGDYRRLSRLGLYGDFFSFYLCDVTLKVNGPNGDPVYIDLAGQQAGRCTPE
ncbi:mammalian cell entry protein [Williamsia sp. 1138]|uniref:MCE family protein n=1 Tax=Williamsia sp. 1138 TaxID=1903117 RepID=UPI000A117C0D|nr:MCE family protein [Williamsia sp. 1138]OZG28875.1 mammalian cell entry protein [Williamsia sp. 1138]